MDYSIKSGIFGLVVADALGVPYEFKDKHYCDMNPMTDMIGHGTYNQEAGTWSDDSSIALATLDGLTDYEFGEDDVEGMRIKNFAEIIDYDSIAHKFADWLINKKYTPHGDVFDVGNTTSHAIYSFYAGKVDALHAGGAGKKDAGNGSLMRILPVSFLIYFLSLKYDFDEEGEMEAIHNLSSITHRTLRCQMACGIYIKIALELLKNYFDSEDDSNLLELVNNGINSAREYYETKEEFAHELSIYEDVFSLEIQDFDRDDIKGSGYVVEALKAALWCLLNNDTYKDTALAAVNLGHDTDTTAAIAGGLAGIYYGYDGIPSNWLDKIARHDYIEELCDNLSDYLFEILED